MTLLSMEDPAEHLFRLERRLHRGDVRTDPAQLELLLAEDFREFGASGRIWSKPDILADLKGAPLVEIDASDLGCQMLSEQLALLTYRSRSRTAGMAWRESLRSSLWRLDRSGWRLVFHQGTPVPPTAASAKL